MLIGVPLIRSHKNCARPRLINPVLDNGYRLKNMMKVRVFSSGLNFVVSMEVPFAEIACSSPRIRRMSDTAGSVIIGKLVCICRSSDTKKLCNIIRIDGEFFSSNPTL